MKYQIILADPPWKYSCWAGQDSRVADAHYPVMSTQQICDMRPMIDNIADDDCALFMWGVPPMMPDAFKVMDAWGFRYISFAFLWVKTNSKPMSHKDQHLALSKHKPLITLDDNVYTVATGMGTYTRANSEPCFLAVRGKMPVTHHDVNQIILSPRRSHSEKPKEQYKKIQRLYPNKKRIELFARSKQPGWHAWGNEVKSTITNKAA